MPENILKYVEKILQIILQKLTPPKQRAKIIHLGKKFWNKNLKLHQKYSKYSLYFSWKSSVLCFRDFAGIYIIDL